VGVFWGFLVIEKSIVFKVLYVCQNFSKTG
jgi:hypothetical protein